MAFLHTRKRGKHAVKLMNGRTPHGFSSVGYVKGHSACKKAKLLLNVAVSLCVHASCVHPLPCVKGRQEVG